MQSYALLSCLHSRKARKFDEFKGFGFYARAFAS